MKGEAFAAWSPLEVGDTVRTNDGGISTVTDVLIIHRSRSNDVQICYELFGRRVVPLSFIKCRVVDGRDVEIGEERTRSERMKV